MARALKASASSVGTPFCPLRRLPKSPRVSAASASIKRWLLGAAASLLPPLLALLVTLSGRVAVRLRGGASNDEVSDKGGLRWRGRMQSASRRQSCAKTPQKFGFVTERVRARLSQ